MAGSFRAAAGFFFLACLSAAPAWAQDGLALGAGGTDVPLGLIGSARDQALGCLADAISYEAGNEPEEGQEAVAQVILNRLSSPAYPKTVCGVVYQGYERRTGCQFTFTCDGSLTRRGPGRSWANAMRIAALAIDGQLASPVGLATHYHAFYVTPVWASQLTRVARIGAHIFYRRSDGRAAPGELTLAAGRAGSSLRSGPRPTVLAVWGLKMAVVTPVGSAIAISRN